MERNVAASGSRALMAAAMSRWAWSLMALSSSWLSVSNVR
jgi:hypothetical protein